MSSTDLIRTHYEASKRGDLHGMLAPLAADVSWTEAEGHPYAGTYTGPEAIAANVFARIGSEWNDFRFELEELVEGGETVIGVGTYSGVFRETGHAMTARVVHIWHILGDRVTRFEQIVDTVPLVAATQANGHTPS